MPNVILKSAGKDLITAIREVRALTGLGLKEARDLVNAAAGGAAPVVVRGVHAEQAQAAVRQLQAVGAQAAVEASGPGAVADEVWDDASGGAAQAGRFAVRLLDAGKSKIAVIKVIRELTGLGLKEAKDLSEQCPSTILQGATDSDARAACAALVREGARAEVAGRT